MAMDKVTLGMTLAPLFFAACSQGATKCSNFPSQYARNDIKISQLAKASFDLPEIKIAMSTIRNCYPSHKYMMFNNKLEIYEALTYRHNTYLIVAELDGVSDLIILFEIDKHGRIVASYQSSTQ